MIIEDDNEFNALLVALIAGIRSANWEIHKWKRHGDQDSVKHWEEIRKAIKRMYDRAVGELGG